MKTGRKASFNVEHRIFRRPRVVQDWINLFLVDSTNVNYSMYNILDKFTLYN